MGLVCDLMEDCDMLQQTIAAAKTLTEHGSVALQLAKEAVCRGEDQQHLGFHSLLAISTQEISRLDL